MSLGELRRRGVLAVVTAALAVGVLASCTGSNGAEPTPPVTSTDGAAEPTETPTGTASATATMPEVEKPTPPDAMRRDDIAGAEAAGIYFTELYPYVYATGDLSEWKVMSHPDCVFCNSVIKNVEELVAAGEMLSGGEIEILEVDSSDPAPGFEFFAVDLGIRQQPTTRVVDGVETADSPGGETLLKLAVGRSSGQWVIREGESADYVASE